MKRQTLDLLFWMIMLMSIATLFVGVVSKDSILTIIGFIVLLVVVPFWYRNNKIGLKEQKKLEEK